MSMRVPSAVLIPISRGQFAKYAPLQSASASATTHTSNCERERSSLLRRERNIKEIVPDLTTDIALATRSYRTEQILIQSTWETTSHPKGVLSHQRRSSVDGFSSPEEDQLTPTASIGPCSSTASLIDFLTSSEVPMEILTTSATSSSALVSAAGSPM